jgi:DNA-binding response OmpR family regulator
VATILVLDDDQSLLDLLETIIADVGHTPITAPTLEAVAPEARPDLVIIDLVPLKEYRRADALAWVDLLRQRFGRTPLLIMTAHAEAIAELDRLGADAIMGKPFDVEQLLAKIDELLT